VRPAAPYDPPVSLSAVLFARDLARLTRFYSDVLGVEPSAVSNETWVEFDLQGGSLGLPRPV
jgi:extradiol dioxygenase family protein